MQPPQAKKMQGLQLRGAVLTLGAESWPTLNVHSGPHFLAQLLGCGLGTRLAAAGDQHAIAAPAAWGPAPFLPFLQTAGPGGQCCALLGAMLAGHPCCRAPGLAQSYSRPQHGPLGRAPLPSPQELASHRLADAGAAASDDHPEGRGGCPPQPPRPHHPGGGGQAAQQASCHCRQPERGQGRRACVNAGSAGRMSEQGTVQDLVRAASLHGAALAACTSRSTPLLALFNTHLPAARMWPAARPSQPQAPQAGACPPAPHCWKLRGGCWKGRGRLGRRCPAVMAAALQLGAEPTLGPIPAQRWAGKRS